MERLVLLPSWLAGAMGLASCSCVQSEAAEPSVAEPKVTPVYSEQRLSSGSRGKDGKEGKDGKDGKDDSFKLQRERSRSKQKSLEAKQNDGREGKGVKGSKDSLSEGVVPAAFNEQEPCHESPRLSFFRFPKILEKLFTTSASTSDYNPSFAELCTFVYSIV